MELTAIERKLWDDFKDNQHQPSDLFTAQIRRSKGLTVSTLYLCINQNLGNGEVK